MKRIIYTLFTLVALVSVVSACDTGVAYDHYVSTQVEGWERNDTLAYDVPELRHGGRYGRRIGLRINSAYPFTAISLVVESTVEPGGKTYADTVNLRLYDDGGNILGKGISCFQYTCALPDVDLRKGERLHVSVHHLMRREILPGVLDVGFSLALK